ncbi:TPA: hypothetical protein HA344_01925 [Candidatus Bathyarchaeota archaeon]|nr:hypothetical protein [Candidatus Bathyarchaeota archaeon]
MSLKVPPLSEALAKAEAKLSGVLGGECRITVHHEFPDGLARMVEGIENRKFRQELQYNLKELVERSKKKGFTVILFTLNGEPFAFDLGYNDVVENTYFGDSAATLIERKGVGAVLTALDALYSWEAGYKAVKMITEDQDEAGRKLVEYWGRFGFHVTKRDLKVGVEMRLDLTPENVKALCDRYID